MGCTADKRLEAHTHSFSVGRRPAHGASLLEKLFVNVERLLHMDDLAICFHMKQPDWTHSSTGWKQLYFA